LLLLITQIQTENCSVLHDLNNASPWELANANDSSRALHQLQANWCKLETNWACQIGRHHNC
jgi:hypothetical protein